MDLPSFLIGLVVAWIIALLFYWFQAQRRAEDETLAGANVISLGDHLAQLQGAAARLTELESELVAARQAAAGDRAACQAEIDRLQQEIAALQAPAQQPAPTSAEAADAPTPAEAAEESVPAAAAVEAAAAEPAAAVEAAAAEPAEVAVATAEIDAEPEPEAPVQPDDLQHIEGIGPKIAELLQQGGITTFAQLAAAEEAQVQQLLDNAGENFRLASPASWAQQARLAADGRWDELKTLQGQLRGGRTHEP